MHIYQKSAIKNSKTRGGGFKGRLDFFQKNPYLGYYPVKGHPLVDPIWFEVNSWIDNIQLPSSFWDSLPKQLIILAFRHSYCSFLHSLPAICSHPIWFQSRKASASDQGEADHLTLSRKCLWGNNRKTSCLYGPVNILHLTQCLEKKKVLWSLFFGIWQPSHLQSPTFALIPNICFQKLWVDSRL